MIEFTSVFKSEMEEYLALRKKTLTPDSYRIHLKILQNFDKYIAENGITVKVVDERTVTGWIQQFYEINSARTVSGKVSTLRKFLEYLRYSGFSVFIPSCPKYSDSYVPYIFSDDELEKIFCTADKSEFAFSMLLRLLYGCGLRLGETLSLQMGDVNLDEGVLWLKNTKNKKQRFVPMSRNLTELLRRYCTATRLTGNPLAFLFPAAQQDKHLSGTTVGKMFRNILKTAGIYVKPELNKRGQCLHCFRHLFAVRSFAQAERNGRTLDDSVPFLSVYLGHYDMDGTQKYLKFNGDMFPEYTERFEEFASGTFSEVFHEE